MEPMQSTEFTGENVEEAIATGLKALGVGPGDVIVEVIDEPSRGVFGLGAKEAKVRLRLLRPATPADPAQTEPVEETTVSQETESVDYGDSDTDDEFPDNAHNIEDEELGEDGLIGKQVLEELLDKMDIQADVYVRRAEPSRPGEEAPYLMDVRGKDLSGLIGRRGDTLSSLQYITRLITSRRLERRANVIIDVAGYKSKRSERLRQLATRMADQAVRQDRTMTLEPMPPHERRIIHLALRNRDDVTTQSTGEGSSRKVTIVPK